MKTSVLAVFLLVSALLANAAPASAQTTVRLYPVADNYVDSKYPILAHYGKVTALYVGNSYDNAQNLWGSERIYIRFDLIGLPKNRVIVRATLSLWQYNPPESNETYEAHRVLGNWNETTQNWNSQPSWSPIETSETVAPPRGAQHAEIAVEWDITADVSAWYSGAVTNYGTMIKVAKEEHAQDASSGFWSREYPVEKVNPSLTVELQPDIKSAYVVRVGVAGLASGTPSTITVDGESYASIRTGQVENVILDRGTAHILTVSKLVSGAEGIRYECETNEIHVSTDASHVFVYSAEYLVTFSGEPASLFEMSTTGWYVANTTLRVHRTGLDVVEAGSGTRLVFDGWYLNGAKSSIEPETIVVKGPVKVEGRYLAEYYLNVTSPVGSTGGSGWYARDSVAVFFVDTSTAPVEGILSLLGMKRVFRQWIGSNNFIGIPVEPQGSIVMKEPATIEAVWQDDWSSLTPAAVILALGILILVVAVGRTRKSRASGRSSRMGPVKHKVARAFE